MIRARFLLASAVALGFASTAAPAAAAALAGYGFRSGTAIARFHGEYGDLIDSESRVGFTGGLVARFKLSPLLSVQPEIGWVSKGDEGDLPGLHYEHRLDYLEIPVLLRLGLPTGPSVEPFLLAGPGLGIRTGSGVKLESRTSPSAPAATGVQPAIIYERVGTFDGPRFRSQEWSAIGGAGLALGRGPLRIVLDTRYALGLTGILEGADRSWAHNRAWITTLGFELR
ncbi:MAG TPA: porin family protein [Candidatus Eisenbacteria bacterium]|jgi:hypothetical protein